MAGMGKQAFAIQNRWRKRQGVGKLVWDKRIAVTAKAACYVIIKRGELRHDPRWYVGLRKALGNVEVAENIGWSGGDDLDEPKEIIAGWDGSPVHDHIMRDPTLKRGAIASVYSRKLGRRVWVAHYAGR